MTTKEKFERETIDLIKQILCKNPSGGALHIVLDDLNCRSCDILWCLNNSIQEEKEDRELFTKCAVRLLRLGNESIRERIICQAADEMWGKNG